MSISSQQLWPYIREAFGIPESLSVIDFDLHLSTNNVATVSMTTLASYNPDENKLAEIKTKFELGQEGVPREQITASYWAGVQDGRQSQDDPHWMRGSHLIALNAKQEIQQMVDKFQSQWTAKRS